MIEKPRAGVNVAGNMRARPSYLSVVTFVLVTLLAMGNARAGGSDDRARAQELQAEGLKLMQKGSYREALAHFEQALSLVPSPKIAFNMGKAHMALGNEVQALEAFERFLDEAPGAPKPSRDEARKAVEALRPKLAYLEIQAEESGGAVLIDGFEVGTLPLPRPKVVKPGPHEVRVNQVGMKPYMQTIFAGAGQKARVVVKLIAIPKPPPPPVVATVPSPPPPPPPRIVEATPGDAGGTLRARPDDREPANAREGSGRRWAKPAAFVAGGLGVLLVGGGVAAQFESANKNRAFNAVLDPNDPMRHLCAQNADQRGGGPCADLFQDGQKFQTLAIVGFAAGGAALAGALVFALLAPHSSDAREREVAAACAPAGGGTGGLSCALSLHY